MCLCFPRHIHSSCNAVMALLCIPVSKLVSCAFSTIPICPFSIQRIFSFTCLHSFFTCVQQLFSYMYIHDYLQTIAALALPTCSKCISKEGLELFGLPTMELCFVKKCITGSRSAQCNMHDLSHYMRPCNSYVVALMWDCMAGHGNISTDVPVV